MIHVLKVNLVGTPAGLRLDVVDLVPGDFQLGQLAVLQLMIDVPDVLLSNFVPPLVRGSLRRGP